MESDRRSSSVTNGLLIVVLLGVLFIIGFLIYHEQQDAERRLQTQRQLSEHQTNKVKDINKSANSLDASYGDPVERLNTLYSQYIAEASSHQGDSGIKAFQDKGYINQSFTGDINGEPLLCGQEMVPDKVAITLTSKKDQTAILQVKKIYDDGSSASNVITAEMAPNSANLWALSKVTCTRS